MSIDFFEPPTLDYFEKIPWSIIITPKTPFSFGVPDNNVALRISNVILKLHF